MASVIRFPRTTSRTPDQRHDAARSALLSLSTIAAQLDTVLEMTRAAVRRCDETVGALPADELNALLAELGEVDMARAVLHTLVDGRLLAHRKPLRELLRRSA